MILGTYALSAGYYDAYYVKAQKVRTIIKREFDAVFEKVDALVTPTSPTVAFPIGAKTNDPLQMYLNDVFTLPVNIAGLPGLSMPCGLSEGLPVGLQLIANSYQERMLFRVAAAFEGATEHHQQHPMRAA
jgi:aspartyl-tRNA(Asn)/glutamyl-tRNA(Gln) amidotransferase subunit A